MLRGGAAVAGAVRPRRPRPARHGAGLLRGAAHGADSGGRDTRRQVAPRATMLAADAVRAVLVTALAVFAVSHVASLAALAPVAALLGAGEGVFIPASFSI